MRASLARVTIGVIEKTAERTQTTDTDRKQTIQASEQRGQRKSESDADYRNMIR